MSAVAACIDPSVLVVPLERATNVAEHGAKAVGLARLMRAGLPVPPGIVVAHTALTRFLTAGATDPGVEAAGADLMSTRVAGDLSARITANALHLAQGGALAVRSSAAGEDGAHASYAGQLDTVLGVEPASGLEEALKRVWASRWSARVLAYERVRNAPLSGMGVIVQRQIDALYAGVLFTVSPEENGEGEMLCEYDEGLADRLVAGEVTPGRVAISRSSFEPVWKSDLASGARPCHEWVERIARAGATAETLFGSPQDIEWAIDRDGKLWLLQSRPITARAAAATRGILWSNANVNENFPHPISPLLYSVAAAGYTRYFHGLGVAFGISRRRLARLESDMRTIIGVHAGRMYYNLTSIHAVLRGIPFGATLAGWFDDFVGARGPSKPGQQNCRGIAEKVELACIALKTTWQYLFLDRRLANFERGVERYAERTARAALARKGLLELRDDLRTFLDIRLHGWTGAALSDAAAMASYGALKALLARAFPEKEHAQIHHDLLKGLDGLVSATPVNALWELSRRIGADDALRDLFGSAAPDEVARALERDPRYGEFNAALKSYLERWGYRFSGELMLTVPSFQERPQELIAILATYAAQDGASPAQRLEKQRLDRIAQTRRVLGRLAKRRLHARLPWIAQSWIARPMIAAAQASIGYRERARLKQALLYSRLRGVALEIGERLARSGRFGAPDDVFFLTMTELDELLSGSAMFPEAVRELVALRRRLHDAFSAMQPPDVMSAREGEYPAFGAAEPRTNEGADGEAVLGGTSVCGGIALGRARVLHSVAQVSELAAGEILVTRQTDPGWAPAFIAIGGLVLERGGMLSHGAILAREYGIPTLVGVKDAAKRIADGSSVRVDGDRGVVEILR